MEKFEDAAMGIAFGKISKTVDGGKTSEIYITKDGGNSFNKLEIINSDIYIIQKTFHIVLLKKKNSKWY